MQRYCDEKVFPIIFLNILIYILSSYLRKEICNYYFFLVDERPHLDSAEEFSFMQRRPGHFLLHKRKTIFYEL